MTYDPATTEAQEREEDRLDAITIAFETAALAIVARALGRITPDTTITDALIAQTADMAELEALAIQCEADVYKAIADAFGRMAEGNDAWAAKYYDFAGKPSVSTSEDLMMSAKLSSGRKQTQRDALAKINTSVIGIGRGKSYKPFAEGYRAAVSRAVSAMAVGESTYNQTIAQTTRELARSGLRVLYPSGRTVELCAAVRTSIMDGYRDTMAAIREEHGVKFGANGVEISAHPMSAPDHLPYQGKQFTKREFENINSGLSRPIETGANCRHIAYAVIVGAPDAYTPEQLQAMNASSTRNVTFTGAAGSPLTMSAYEATQYQRQLERSVREHKTDAYLAGAESRADDRRAANSRARSAAAYYSSFCEETGLTPRPQRLRIYAG